jgi:hypothetical protein
VKRVRSVLESVHGCAPSTERSRSSRRLIVGDIVLVLIGIVSYSDRALVIYRLAD